MPKMIELIRQLAVPASLLRSASRGALALPPGEMLEILVHLTTLPAWRNQAQLTLAGWEEASTKSILSDPTTPVEVLRYFVDPANAKAGLVVALADNPAVPLASLVRLGEQASANVAERLLDSERVRNATEVLQGLAANKHLSPPGLSRLEQLMEALGGNLVEADPYTRLPAEDREFETRFAAEIAAAEGMPFSLVDSTPEERQEIDSPSKAPADSKRLTILQRISRLTVGERIQLAMRGARDERFVLIRDSSRIVAVAVIESPKVGETEMESFAGMKNVQEDVLRAIARNRRFMKNYAVIRALANNPRAPLEVALQLLPHLLSMDLRHLSQNKNVTEMVRKMALKLFRQKSESGATH